MAKTTTLLVVVAAVGIVLRPDGGDCQRRELCANRPWSSPTVDADRARVVDAPLGSAVAFLCHYCGERDGGGARNWYMSHRLQSHSGNASATVSTANSRKEVVLGMADPVDSNRVYMTYDHSLVIRDLASSDISRYSCSGLGSDEHIEFALDLLPAADRLATVSADSMADWTRYESRYFAPVAEKFPQVVRQMGVDWDPWGPCDGCAGKRYRRAACRVTFDDGTRMACRSIGLPASVTSALAATLSSVPDFLLAETCYAYCQLSSNRSRGPKYRNTFVLEEGSSLTLVCAEATADQKVTWRRDGLLLTTEADAYDDDDVASGPVLDAFGTLYLVALTADGGGNYTCYVNGNRTQEVLVAVRRSSVFASDAYVRHLCYVYYACTLYAVVFGARVFYAYLGRRDFLSVTDDDVLPPEVTAVYLGKRIRIR